MNVLIITFRGQFEPKPCRNNLYLKFKYYYIFIKKEKKI